MSDTDLLDRCRRGDDRAWSELVHQYQRLVFSIGRSLGLGEEDAGDVVQSTFSSLLRSMDRIDRPERLSAWLSTVARRESIRIVARLTHDRPSTEADPRVTDDATAQAIVEDVEWLHQGLAHVSPRCQRLLIAQYFSGHDRSYAELSEQLAMPVGSVGPTRQRCLSELRQVLAALMDDRSGDSSER